MKRVNGKLPTKSGGWSAFLTTPTLPAAEVPQEVKSGLEPPRDRSNRKLRKVSTKTWETLRSQSFGRWKESASHSRAQPEEIHSKFQPLSRLSLALTVGVFMSPRLETD